MLVRSWELHLLVLAAALFMLPGAPIDGDVLKGAFCALFVLPVVLLSLAWRAGTAAAGWLGSAGGRLYVASLLAALLGGLLAHGYASPVPSSVPDRILVVSLSLGAALLGAVAARRHPDALWSAVGVAGCVTGAMALLQVLGYESDFSPPPELTAGVKEVVALMGNSTRAGALLALVLPALVAVLVTRLAQDRSRHARTHTLRWPIGGIALVTAGLVVTQARGARLAALAGLVAVLAARWLALRSSTARPDTRAGAQPLRRRWVLTVVGSLVLGALIAWLAGGNEVWLARKLPDSGSILAGRDVTTSVRLSVWRSTAFMVTDGPLLGHGLGLFRESFAPHRAPAEASLPGLQGTPTEVWHPHDEWLLAAAEGGWIAALLLALFAGATLVRAWRSYRDDGAGGDLAALGMLVAGTAAGLVQDAWTSPGTAVIFFAAAGHAWSPHVTHPHADRRRGPALAVTLALTLALVLVAWPRWSGHFGAWTFQRRAEAAGGILPGHFEGLARAAAAAPHDIDLQRMTRFIGLQLLSALPRAQRADVSRALADVVLRIEALQARAPTTATATDPVAPDDG